MTPLVTVSNPAVVVEAVKLAEDRSGDVIVRLYESLGGAIDGNGDAPTSLRRPCGSPICWSVRSTVPRHRRRIPPVAITLALRPFESVTLRIGRVDS